MDASWRIFYRSYKLHEEHQADLLSDALHLLLMEHGMESELNAQMSLSVSRCMCRELISLQNFVSDFRIRAKTALCYCLNASEEGGSAAYNNRYDVYLSIVRLLTANQFGSKEGVGLKDMEDDGDVLELNGLVMVIATDCVYSEMPAARFYQSLANSVYK
uniref:Uncharacterized protein n=1 Tax=Parascaris equorum TaxID=6256 RepID=A0A914RZ84_PAREQ